MLEEGITDKAAEISKWNGGLSHPYDGSLGQIKDVVVWVSVALFWTCSHDHTRYIGIHW